MLDLCIKREGQLIRVLREKLAKSKPISEPDYRDPSPQSSISGTLYGLPKIHKENCPIRPIMSAIGTYKYGLAKFLVPMLQHSASNQNTVSNYFIYVKETTNPSFSHNTVMVSYDVASPLINISLHDTANLILDSLFRETYIFRFNDCSFTRSQFKDNP